VYMTLVTFSGIYMTLVAQFLVHFGNILARSGTGHGLGLGWQPDLFDTCIYFIITILILALSSILAVYSSLHRH
jgi:hypothetical protein